MNVARVGGSGELQLAVRAVQKGGRKTWAGRWTDPSACWKCAEKWLYFGGVKNELRLAL